MRTQCCVNSFNYMDNKPMELEALCYIESLVARYGYQYAELNSDSDGCDFIIFENGEIDTYVYLRCQSKGRCVSHDASNVSIPQSYVRDNFLVFVYVKPEDEDCVSTYLYFADDIKTNWKIDGDTYRLYLPKTFVNNHDNDIYLLKKKRALLIGELLRKVGVQSSQRYIKFLSDSEFYFRMWQKTGGLPAIEYLRGVFDGDDSQELLGIDKFIFMLCASVIQNRDSDICLSIDWAFQFLVGLNIDTSDIGGFHEGKEYRSNVAIVYTNTWVKELLSVDDTLLGYLLHIGDREESADVCVMRGV